MKTKGTIIFIYNIYDRSIVNIPIDMAKYYGFNTKFFTHPEDFKKWVVEENPNFRHIDLIIMSSFFSGDGRPNIKTGNYRGLEFYREERKKQKNDNVFYQTKTIIVAYTNNDQLRLKENGVVLKKEDEFIDSFDLVSTLESFLEKKK